MNRLSRIVFAAAVGCSISAAASAQVSPVANLSFETPRSVMSPTIALGWNHFTGTFRRTAGAGILIRTGIASIEAPGGQVFTGVSSNVRNPAPLGPFNDLIYGYGCGPVTLRAWYAIPANRPLTSQRAGLKFEFRRPNTSIYDQFESFSIGPELDGVGHTNGQWRQVSITVTQADFNWIFNYFNNGVPYPDFPTSVSLLLARFGAPATDNGTIFFDDVEAFQLTDASGYPVEFWDDKNVVLTAEQNAGVQEPGVPLWLNGTQLGFGCAPQGQPEDVFDLVNITDLVPGTGAFPLTWADIIANGYVRPLVQTSGGTTQDFGTSIITSPSFRPLGQPLDLIPDISRADANITYTPAVPPTPPDRGPPLRASPVSITGTGNYGGAASIVTTRNYPDPLVGLTSFTVQFTWTASQNITLQSPGVGGRGNDAFRLITLSSMLASATQYDGKYIGVENAAGVKRTITVPVTPRGVHVYPAPQPTAVGRSFYLYKDGQSTFNPTSASIEVQIDSISANITGGVGVQAFLDSSTNPNDDSLSVWLEWIGAPAVIPSGTVITGSFTVFATSPTNRGDINHNGVIDSTDAGLQDALQGRTLASPDYDAYADMDNDGDIDAADCALLRAITGGGPCAPPSCPGDVDGNGSVGLSDIAIVTSNWTLTVPPAPAAADQDGNGSIGLGDIAIIVSNWSVICP